MQEPQKKKPVCPGMWVEDPSVTLSRNLHKLLNKWQRKTGGTIRSFCDCAGIAHSTLYDSLQRRRWPTSETVRKIASTLGIPVEVLFRR